MIICVCNNVSDKEINQALELGCSTIEDLKRDLSVGVSCGNCKDCACQLINTYNKQHTK